MSTFETYYALIMLIQKQKLTNATKLSKILKIKQLAAKDILAGDIERITDAELIRHTSTLILSRLKHGA